jgi:hypothetical protein
VARSIRKVPIVGALGLQFNAPHHTACRAKSSFAPRLDFRFNAGMQNSIIVVRPVERLAKLAVQAGLRGLVCSPLETAGLRFGPDEP